MQQLQLRDIFTADESNRRADLLLNQKQLIHYCSAETALKIIKNEEIWLRNVRVMNDFSEVNHGFNLITRSLYPPVGPIETGMNAVKNAIDAVHPGASAQTLQQFQSWSPWIQNETYVTCLSEHPENEQADGRLSMWRNYSEGQAGVGLVVDISAFGTFTDTLGVWSTPVFYNSDAELDRALHETAQSIRDHAGQLAAIDRQQIIGYFFIMLRSIAHGTKHPGFAEEREWRVFHTLQLDPMGQLRLESETLGGLPQRILKLKLGSFAGVPSVAIKDLIKGVLIGPSMYQDVIARALGDELLKKGKADGHQVIRMSPIPLRT